MIQNGDFHQEDHKNHHKTTNMFFFWIDKTHRNHNPIKKKQIPYRFFSGKNVDWRVKINPKSAYFHQKHQNILDDLAAGKLNDEITKTLEEVVKELTPKYAA